MWDEQFIECIEWSTRNMFSMFTVNHPSPLDPNLLIRDQRSLIKGQAGFKQMPFSGSRRVVG